MTSDKERREAAEKLRNGITYYEDDETYVETCEGGDILETLGIEACDPFLDDGFPRSSVEHLADLIDRPTCHMDLTETVDFDCVEIRFWECGECGQTYEEINGAYEYCPHCGAEVLDDTVDGSD